MYVESHSCNKSHPQVILQEVHTSLVIGNSFTTIFRLKTTMSINWIVIRSIFNGKSKKIDCQEPNGANKGEGNIGEEGKEDDDNGDVDSIHFSQPLIESEQSVFISKSRPVNMSMGDAHCNPACIQELFHILQLHQRSSQEV